MTGPQDGAISTVMPFRLTCYPDGTTACHVDFTTAAERDHCAAALADATGMTVYTARWQPALPDGDDWVTEAHLEPGLDDGDYITISLTIDNTYQYYDSVTTRVDGVRIPAPPDEADVAAFDEWAYRHIHAFTGVGHLDGDSWYDVTVTACTDPALIGRTFDFGY